MRWLFGTVLAWGFVVVGGGVLVFAVVSRYEAEESEGWPSTTGRVVEAYLDEYQHKPHYRRSETRYHPVVRYTYVVDGVSYTGDRITVNDPGSSLRYTEGDEVTVYYNPDRPERAVLEVGMSNGSTVAFVFAGLLVLGTGLLFLLLSRWSPYRPAWSYGAKAARQSRLRLQNRVHRRPSR